MANLSRTFYSDPLTFLGRNAFVCNYQKPKMGNIGRYVFDISKNMNVLRNANDDKEANFAAYYLPYSDNNTHSIRLGRDASYMITPALTGCTFIIINKWHSPMVAHSNYQNDQGQIDQPKINTELGKTFNVVGCSTVKKADYMSPDDQPLQYQLFVIGIRYSISGWYLYRVKHELVQLGKYKLAEGPTRIN